MYKIFHAVVGTIGGFVGYFIGGCDGLCYALLTFIVVDYVSGVLCAISEKNLSSSIGFKGICKKILIIILVGVANIVDIQLIKKGAALRTTTIFFYIANEGISIIENVSRLGLPLPSQLKHVLSNLSENKTSETILKSNVEMEVTKNDT